MKRSSPAATPPASSGRPRSCSATDPATGTPSTRTYGEVAFPLQIVTVLDRPGVDFDGGEFVLAEQRPRAQTRAHVQQLQQGAFLVFATRNRPAEGRRGYHRTAIRHGVSTLTRGRRTTLGVIFHDAA